MSNRICQTGHCLEEVHARNLCLKHYQALWRAEQYMEPGERERRRQLNKRQPDPEAYWEWVKKELQLNG